MATFTEMINQSLDETFKKKGFEGKQLQEGLPTSLQLPSTGVFTQAGIQNIGGLIQRPGEFDPRIQEMTRERMAAESRNIAQNFANLRAGQAGASARGNLPLSIRDALNRALDTAQSRAQSGSRRDILAESDAQRRADLDQTFDLLNAILQFSSSARGQQVAGLQAKTAADAQTSAANTAMIGSILGSLATSQPQQPSAAPPKIP